MLCVSVCVSVLGCEFVCWDVSLCVGMCVCVFWMCFGVILMSCFSDRCQQQREVCV